MPGEPFSPRFPPGPTGFDRSKKLPRSANVGRNGTSKLFSFAVAAVDLEKPAKAEAPAGDRVRVVVDVYRTLPT